jgi:hypothetical protein
MFLALENQDLSLPLSAIKILTGTKLVQVCFESNMVDVPFHTWWLDTGANIHVTNFLHELQNSKKSSNEELKVNMGNSVKVEVEYICTAKLVLASGHFLDLKGMAFVPSIRRNLSLFLFWTSVDTILRLKME